MDLNLIALLKGAIHEDCKFKDGEVVWSFQSLNRIQEG
jgi:hypothetical protein